METQCWFCGKRIRPGKATNRHHTIARRYYAGNPNRGNLVVLCHRTCHSAWHRDIDRGDLPYPFYIVLMQALNFGWMFYAEEEHHGCSVVPVAPRLAQPLLSAPPPASRRPRSRHQVRIG